MLNTINIIGFVQAVFGILVFLTKRPKHLSFTLLAVWMAVISIHLGASLLPFRVVDYFKPGIFPVSFLSGPLLYLYISSLTVENFKLKPQHLIHLLPLLLVAIHRSIIPVVDIASSSDLSENPNFVYNKIYYSLIMISALLYWVLGWQLLIKHRKNIPLYFSNYSGKNSLNWLLFVLSLFLVVFIASFISFFINNILGLGIVSYTKTATNMTIFTFIMVYFGINQSAIYSKKKPTLAPHYPHTPAEEPDFKPANTPLTQDQVESLSAMVTNYLIENRPYRNPEYNLQMMADDLQISRHKLSHIINSGQQKNFYKLINQFRVAEVKLMLTDPSYQHYSVLGIAMECGFNAKTSFNRIFKEETGLTPTEYKLALDKETKARKPSFG
ncbi:MAG: helix-turn-helix domain-containing protein [Imperialibacter sp.]|uniref:helix-turn-helix domain-containing protein n=1 Tax=Imperialibacter sp. TaxID=2038411 RepID=UPI0032EC459A